MTDPNYVHRIIVADISGSMREILDGMRSGYREFIAMQRQLLADMPGMRMTVSLWQFDTIVERAFSFASLDEVDGWLLEPRGWTALHDAVCMSVIQEGKDLAALPEDRRPGQVSLLVVSDGKENSSREHTGDQARELVTHQRDVYNWDVTFLGANMNAALAGAELGSNVNLQYTNTNASAQGSWSSASSRYTRNTKAAVAVAAAGGDFDFAEASYTDEEREHALGNDPAAPATASAKRKTGKNT